MPRRVVLLLAGVLSGVGVVVGLVVLLGGDDAGAPPASLEPDASNASDAPTSATPEPVQRVALADVDTLTTAVRRGAFCDRVAPEAVAEALGGPESDTTSYRDGQDAQVTGQVRDIAHEYGCGWTTRRTAARAWVFAPPVTPRVATALVRSARREPGCRPLVGAATFGAPTVALVCGSPRGPQASFRGLFGDAWLTCTVAGDLDRVEVVDRADHWCVAVLDALAS